MPAGGDPGDSDPNTGHTITAQKISTTQYATLDDTLAANGIQPVTPLLQFRKTCDPAFGSIGFTPVQRIGVTENVVGPSGVAPDLEITLKSRSVGNQDVSVNFTVNPRLAQPAEHVRFDSAVKPAGGSRLSIVTTGAFNRRGFLFVGRVSRKLTSRQLLPRR